jgi:hypothetical protein
MDGKQGSMIITMILVVSFFLITAPHISAKTILASTPILHRKLIDPACGATGGDCIPGTGCCQGPHPPGEKSSDVKDVPSSAYP